jgi:hypothetical protein
MQCWWIFYFETDYLYIHLLHFLFISAYFFNVVITILNLFLPLHHALYVDYSFGQV